VHLAVDRVQRGHVEEPAGDAGLVGRDHDPVAFLGEARDRLQAPGDGLPFVRALDERGAVESDDAVAVEDDELHGAKTTVCTPEV
jgi:hypothetical protein